MFYGTANLMRKGNTFFRHMQQKCKKMYQNLHKCKKSCNFAPQFMGK